MAEEQQKRPAQGAEEEAPKNDLTALVMHVTEHPWPYIGAAAFVVAVLVATGIYRSVQESALREDSTVYMRAIEKEAPAERAEALASLAGSDSVLAARALYLEGEAAIDSGDYDKARESFEKLRDRYPDFQFVPDAVEGLGFIAEESGNFERARSVYGEVAQKWPDSAAAKRQPYNLARCYEGEENFAAAVEQYRAQLEKFPGSTISMRAQQRLNELRGSHPDLFTDEANLNAGAPVLQELTTAPAAEPAQDQLQLRNDFFSDDETEESAEPEPPAQPE